MACAIVTALALSGCLGGEDSATRETKAQPDPPGKAPVSLPSKKRLARLGLTIGPPANLVAACRHVARQSPLTVYCPPVVPKGAVEAPTLKHRRENAYVYGDSSGYGLSLQSASLIDPERARAFDPEGPSITFPNRPRYGDNAWNPLAAKHWAVAAKAPAGGAVKSVDESVAYPRADHKSSPQRFTVRGVEATLVTGDTAGSGFASSGHAIVYWRIGDTFHQASVHFDDKARVAKEIARALINQMVSCAPSSTAREAKVCEWVFPGRR